MSFQCSFCPRSFNTSQQLGGHQTYHREEINMLRGEHDKFLKRQRRQHQRKLRMELLTPNPAFWVLYRISGIKPMVIDFFQGTYKVGELFGPKEKKNHKATSQDVDLILKL